MDKVYTIADYYDGPRVGVAELNGQPHAYENLFHIHLDDYSEYFALKPISIETLQLALEAWAIWNRWDIAFRTKNTTRDTHPALPEDRIRSDQLSRILKASLLINLENAIIAKAEFKTTDQPRTPMSTYEVEWFPVSSDLPMWEYKQLVLWTAALKS